MAPPGDAGLGQRLQRWADGKATLKEVRGYSDEELYSIARLGYFFFYQGKVEEARTVFQGLYALNPLDPYVARALGVIELATGNPAGALTAYEVALKVSPEDAAAWVGRAEVRLAQGQRPAALEDLRRARGLLSEGDPLAVKVDAMLKSLTRKEKERTQL